MQDILLSTLIFSLFFACSVIELLSESPYVEKEIPEAKMTLAPNNVPTVTIQYCHSCGYQKAFTEYAGILSEKYPNFKILGEYYEPGGLYMILARLLNFGRMFLIIFIVLESNVFAFIGLREPAWWRWCVSNKIYACLCIFFFFNMFENMLVSSGAFEISLNGVPLWSKIESGRIPQPQELFRIIDAQMNFEPTTIEMNPTFRQ